MTVEELIEALQECDPDEQCYVRINGNFFEIENSGILRLSHFPFAFVHQREQK